MANEDSRFGIGGGEEGRLLVVGWAINGGCRVVGDRQFWVYVGGWGFRVVIGG